MRGRKMRDVVFECLDALDAEDVAKARKLGRQIRGMGPPAQRELYELEWAKAHPGSSKIGDFVRNAIERRKEAERAKVIYEPIAVHRYFG